MILRVAWSQSTVHRRPLGREVRFLQSNTIAASSKLVVSQFCSVSVNVPEIKEIRPRVTLPATAWETTAAHATDETSV